MEADGGLDALFLRLMRERLAEWLDLADSRLRPMGMPLYFMLGNDDPEELGAAARQAPWGTHDEGKVVWLDDEHEMISWGYSNVTPWHTYREQTDEQLARRSTRPGAPAATPRARGVQPARAAVRHPARRGAAARREPRACRRRSVRCSMAGRQHRGARRRAERQPMLGLHGHIHESSGIRRIGRAPGHQPGQRLLDRRAERRADHPRRRQGQGAAAGVAGSPEWPPRDVDALVSIDVGTSGARATAFDTSGAPLLEVRRSYPTDCRGRMGGAGRDRAGGRRALSALGTLIADARAAPHIHAIGLTGQCPSVVPIDARDRPLRPGHHLPRQPRRRGGRRVSRAVRRRDAAHADRARAGRVPRRREDPLDPRARARGVHRDAPVPRSRPSSWR